MSSLARRSSSLERYHQRSRRPAFAHFFGIDGQPCVQKYIDKVIDMIADELRVRVRKESIVANRLVTGVVLTGFGAVRSS
jgi:hypothetical protein